MRTPPVDDRTIERRIVALAGILAAWVLYLSLYPFDWASPSEARQRFLEGVFALRPYRWLGHIATSFLLGVAVGLVSRNGGVRRHLVGTWGFLLAVELLQCMAVSRHPRLGDFVLGAASASIGALSAHSFVVRWGFTRLPQCTVVLFRILAIGLPLVLAWWVVDRLQRVALRDWDTTYGLAVGNELDGKRAWSGCVRGVALYGRAVGEEDAGELTAGAWGADALERRASLGLAALYSASDVATGAASVTLLPDRMGRLDLAAAGAPLASAANGICVGRDAWLRSSGPAGAVSEELQRGSEFAIESSLSAREVDQSGPARILTISADPYARNVTLGQEGAELVLRVRSVENGKNGNDNEARWADVFVDDSFLHLLVSYSRGEATLFVDGGPAREPTRLVSPSLVPALDLPVRPWLVFLLVCLPAGWFARSGWPRSSPVRSALAAGALAFVLLYSVDAYGARGLGTGTDATLALVALVGLPLGVFATAAFASSDSG